MSAKREKSAWFQNLPIQIKMVLAIAALLALFLIACLVILKTLSEQSDARGWTNHTYEVINETQRAVRNLREQQVGIRGFLLSADDRELQLETSGSEDFDRHLDKLRTLTGDNPIQQARLDHISELKKRWQTDVADVAVASVRDADKAGDRRTDLMVKAARAYLDGVNVYVSEIVSSFESMEQTERDLLAQRVARQLRFAEEARWITVGALLLDVLLGLMVLEMVSRLITRPIRDLTGLMTQLAQNDRSIMVPLQHRGDEVGAIARALEVFKRMSIETADTNWVKTHVGEVSAKIQMAVTHRDFGGALLGETAPRIGVGIAAFYGYRDDLGQLELLASYGVPDPWRRMSFAPGQSLAGQCLVARKPIIVDQVPADYFQIHSGLGAAYPKTIILLPVFNLDRVIGVLELGSFGSFSELHQRFLDELMPLLGLSLENLSRALRTQQLLEETQTQSEELKSSEEALRVQQEELRATNDELHSRTRQLEQQSSRLRTSEEELRAQTEELRASNEELREKGERLNQQRVQLEILQQETQGKADDLSRASQYKSDFLANMSHELRTPLNSLLILSRSLADNDEGNLDAEQIESARIIHESGSNLLRLINDILDLSKVEAGKMEVVADDLALESFASSIRRMFRHVATEKGLEFTVDIEPGLPPTLRTDPGKLEQIANNLLSNAFKFTHTGQVRMLIGRPAAQQAPLPGLTADQCLSFTVTDSGIGIPAEKFQNIFQAFEQVDAGTSRQYGGTGLGLSICRGMARLLGGDIRLQSQVGEGSTFILLLPQSHDASKAVGTPPLPALATPEIAPALAHHQPIVTRTAPIASIADDRDLIGATDTVILIIEDDLSFQRILGEMVRRKGFRVLAAADGESGLMLAAQYRPTGVLLDVMLPGMNGWTVMDRLKADAGTRHIPVHFISAVDEHSRGLDLGAVGFLTKPVSREAIGQAFDRLLHFAPGATRRVLIVDDDAGSRAAVRKLVTDGAVECLEAESGEEALKVLADSEIDCIILDLGLPGMDGFEFLERASTTGEVPPVVVYSGRELSREENLRLRQYTDSIVIKGARSPERLLDEVSLFLHSIRAVPSALPSGRSELDSALSGRTVLIVDDDMRNIFALSKALRGKGLKVLMAQDGHKALKQIEDNPGLDIVLMDIMMPGMDGYETIGHIRSRPELAKMPIIALTAKAMRGDREKCLAAGANDYLSKPVDVGKLLSMMRVWVR